MNTKALNLFIVFLMTDAMLLTANASSAEKPFIIGGPLSTAFLFGWVA